MASIETRSTHYELVRSMTILLVVVGHVCIMYTDLAAVPYPIPSSFLANVAYFVYAFHMPMFMAISGMVYGICVDDLDKYRNYLKYIWKKAERLLIPYVVFGVLYVAPVVVGLGLTDRRFFSYCVHEILCADNPRHLWYLVALFWIFMVIGLFRPLVKRLPPIIFLIPLVVLSYFAITDFPFATPMGFQFRNTCKQGVWFFLGYAFNRHYDRYMKVLKFKLAFMICLVAELLTFKLPIDGMFFLNALFGMGMLVSLAAQFPVGTLNNWFFRLFKKDGMGIYLFHPMLLYLGYYFFGGVGLQPIAFALLMFVGSIIVSILATELLRRFRLGIVLGEASRKKSIS